AALRRLPGEQHEEAALAIQPPRLGGQAIKLGLLAAEIVLVAAHLLGPGRIARAAVEGIELTLQPLADRALRTLGEGRCGHQHERGWRKPSAKIGSHRQTLPPR